MVFHQNQQVANGKRFINFLIVTNNYFGDRHTHSPKEQKKNRYKIHVVKYGTQLMKVR